MSEEEYSLSVSSREPCIDKSYHMERFSYILYIRSHIYDDTALWARIIREKKRIDKKVFIVPIICRRTGLRPTRHTFEQVTNQKLLYYIMTISVYKYDTPIAKVPVIQIVPKQMPIYIPLNQWFSRSMEISIPISMLSPDLRAMLDNMIVK